MNIWKCFRNCLQSYQFFFPFYPLSSSVIMGSMEVVDMMWIRGGEVLEHGPRAVARRRCWSPEELKVMAMVVVAAVVGSPRLRGGM